MDAGAPEIPRRVKVVAWVGIVVAAWNLCAVVILLVFRQPLSRAGLSAPLAIAAACLTLLVFLLVFSIGLLRGHAWGRNGALVSYAGLTKVISAWVMWDWIFAARREGPEHDPAAMWPNPVLVMLLVVVFLLGVHAAANLLCKESRRALARIRARRASRPALKLGDSLATEDTESAEDGNG